MASANIIKLVLQTSADTSGFSKLVGATKSALGNLGDLSKASKIVGSTFGMVGASIGKLIGSILQGGVWGAAAEGVRLLINHFDIFGTKAKEAAEKATKANQELSDATIKSYETIGKTADNAVAKIEKATKAVAAEAKAAEEKAAAERFARAKQEAEERNAAEKKRLLEMHKRAAEEKRKAEIAAAKKAAEEEEKIRRDAEKKMLRDAYSDNTERAHDLADKLKKAQADVKTAADQFAALLTGSANYGQNTIDAAADRKQQRQEDINRVRLANRAIDATCWPISREPSARGMGSPSRARPSRWPGCRPIAVCAAGRSFAQLAPPRAFARRCCGPPPNRTSRSAIPRSPRRAWAF